MKDPYILRPFTKFCITLGMIPSSYKASWTQQEQLLWFCDFLENKVIPAINTNAEAVIELQEYIKTYFDNLDVQDEINNKLDEMAESGELEEIIGDYINLNAIIAFDTLSDLKQSSSLINGSTARTLGYNSIYDGGDGLYKIRELSVSDTVDEGLIVALDNGLVAELVISNNKINIKQFGATGDGETDETEIFQTAIANVPNGTTIYIPSGNYIITEKLILPNMANKFIILEGKTRESSSLLFNMSDPTADCAIQMKGNSTEVLNKSIIKNLRIKNNKENDTSETNGINLNYNLQINCLENISISGFYNNIDLGTNNWSFTLKNIRSLSAKNNGINAYGTINNIHLVGCDIMKNKNSNIYFRGVMNCSIENTDFSVYDDGLYGVNLYYCNSINILNCYFESAKNCSEILAGILANHVDGLFINSIDFSVNAIKENYKGIHILNSHATKIEALNFKNTDTDKCDYGIYYDSSYNNELGSAYFENVKICVYITLSNLIIKGIQFKSGSIINTIVCSGNGWVCGYILNNAYVLSDINNEAKYNCHLIGVNAKTYGSTADRPHIFHVGQVYRDTTLGKIIFGKTLPTFNSSGEVISGDEWCDVDGETI